MKKVVVASLLACAVFAPTVRSAVAQQPVALGAGGAAQPCQMPDAEFKPYNDAITQTDPKAKAAALEAYLTAFPKSSCPNVTQDTLVLLMATYSQAGDAQKTLDTADRILQLDPNNLRALYGEAVIRKSLADANADPTAKDCYKKYHGGDDGYDAVQTAAQANLEPPAGFKDSIKPAPTPAEQIHGIITSTPDLSTLAVSDKEMVFQYGSPEDAAKVWD